MAIDSSIYSNIQPPAQAPNLLGAAETGMKLGQLGIQQAQMQRQMQTQQQVRQAYLTNTDENGNLNQAGVLSDLGKVNPMAAQDVGNTFAASNKSQAEAKAAQLDAVQKTLGVTGPAFDYMAGMPDDQRAAAYPKIIQQLKSQGVDVSTMDHPYDPSLFSQYYGNWQNSKPHLENLKTQAETAKDLSEFSQGPAKLNTELYGSRSPNAELTSQYDKQAAPVRSSQMAMAQMLDNYKNPSPQGDASLVLNAFKIKFPNAPDVNSLKELSESQAAPDAWKNTANKVLSGGLDQPTRDNLMRDGASTFRANVNTLQGIQQRYQARAAAQNVNDPTLTAEPAIDKTYSDAMALQKQIGPYVPPSDRGGFMAGANKLVSKVLGTSGPKSANAAAPSIKPGTVEDGYLFNGGDPSDQKNWKKAY